MGDANSADLKTLENGSNSSSIDNVERKMILLKIAENEKSRFDDVITGAESENGWEDCWKETEDSVTQSIDELDRSIPEEWIDEHPKTIAPSPGVYSIEKPLQSAPHSYYELMDLNVENIDNTVRMARVPSQYQLDALSEMFIFDVPQHYTMRKASANCQPLPTNIVSADQEDRPDVNDWTTPYFVNSEYVSELLM
ncbi:hypothetical protein GCK72_005245 [Caenorhabditis remanei]|nr:hypothetical protein GCK72_005245 [Caenorhabditis remanei]KAF1765293.1 hypothetical protein GCK72_005245 [Caenorhabditis remanei]